MPKMNLGPAGNVPKMTDRWYYDSEGVRAAQKMVFGDENDPTMALEPCKARGSEADKKKRLAGEPKGIKVVLKERDLWTVYEELERAEDRGKLKLSVTIVMERWPRPLDGRRDKSFWGAASPKLATSKTMTNPSTAAIPTRTTSLIRPPQLCTPATPITRPSRKTEVVTVAAEEQHGASTGLPGGEAQDR